MTKKLMAAAALSGCLTWAALSTPASADPFYVDVEIAPPQIETYPSTVYEGQPVYYYDGHWYGRRGPRWVYYRDEPRPLVVYRTSPEYRRRAAPPPRARQYYEARPHRERHHDDRHHDGPRHDDGHHHHRD
jgi:hypothetical protein